MAGSADPRSRGTVARLAHRAPPVGRARAGLHGISGAAHNRGHSSGLPPLLAPEKGSPMTLSVALYARTSAADAGRETVEQILAGLAAYTAGRGWDVAMECIDQSPFPEARREGLGRLVAAVRAKAVQGVVVCSLSHLARSLRHLTDLG